MSTKQIQSREAQQRIEIRSLLQRAVGSIQRGDLAAADAALQCVHALAPHNFDACQLSGAVAHRRGDHEKAIQWMRQAIGINGSVAAVHNNLGTALSAMGLFTQAAESYRRALDLDPASIECHRNLANVYVSLELRDQAIDQIQTALDFSPSDPALLQLLASLQRRSGGATRDERAFTAPSVRVDASELGFWPAMQKAADIGKRGLPAEAIELLKGLSPSQPQEQRAWRFQLAQLLDADRQFDEAFEQMKLANQLAAEMDSGRVRPQAYLDDVAAHRGIEPPAGVDAPETDSVEADSVETDTAGTEAGLAPAFIVGFPRSGTTLLAQMLDAHPQIVTHQEAPMLETLRQEVFCLPGGYPQSLTRLSSDEAWRLRETYFQIAAERTPLPEGARLVDVSATHLRYIPLIKTVFPGAVVATIFRHPADVCLSCLMKDFKPNDLVANFHTLADTAACYRDTMELAAQYGQLADPQPIRYENLVRSPQDTLSEICRRLGLPFDDSMLGFHERAQANPVKTASFDQVNRPLYDSSIDRWRNYEKEIQPLMPVLAPWVRRLGYSD